MSNRPVPATAEGLPQPSPLDFESSMIEAQQFVELAELTANNSLSEQVPDASQRIKLYNHERNMILFAVAQATKAMERAEEAYQAFVRAAR